MHDPTDRDPPCAVERMFPKTKSKARLAKLEAYKAAADEQLRNKEATRREHRKAVSALKEATVKIDGLEAHVKALTGDVARLEGENAALQTRLGEAEALIAQADK